MEAQNAYTLHVMKSAMIMWMTLYCITGKITACELAYFLVGCYLSDVPASCWFSLVGLFVFPAASLAVLIIAIEPAWQVCNEISHALHRRRLEEGEARRKVSVRKNITTTPINHPYVF